MTPFLSRGHLLPLAVAAGFALTPAVQAQDSPAPSAQALENEVVQGKPSDRHLAPHDTFYTMEYVSARTDKGVDGFPPGTEVHLVSVNREARTLTVTDGHANVEVPPDKLTNDMDIAAMVRANDAASQERLARYRQSEQAAYQKYLKEVADYTAKDLAKRENEIRQANEARQEQVNENHTDQSSAAINASYNDGYYNQGGYGYGSPYGYFVDLNGYNRSPSLQGSTNTQAGGSNGRGAVSSSQGAVQSGNSQTGRASAGAASGGTGGGKK